MPIDSFTGDYRFLSNFYIEPDGTCVEVEYQASKHVNYLHDPKSCLALFEGLGPSRAKKLGRQIPLRRDWEAVKLKVMKELVMAKFEDHPDLAAQLAATGNEELIEGNYWGDVYWGICRGTGENHLGKILMKVRSLL